MANPTILALTAALLFTSGCAHRSKLIRDENEVTIEGLFSVWGSWLRDRGDRIDMELRIENRAPYPIAIRTRDIHCSRGHRWGDLHVAGRAGRARRLVIPPDRVRRVVVVCELAHGDIEGDVRILVRQIYEAPRHRRYAPTERLATDVEWTVTEEYFR